MPPRTPFDPEILIGVFIIGGILSAVGYAAYRQAERIGRELDVLPPLPRFPQPPEFLRPRMEERR